MSPRRPRDDCRRSAVMAAAMVTFLLTLRSAPAQSVKTTRVNVQTIDRGSIDGRLLRLDDLIELQTDDGETRRWTVGEAISLTPLRTAAGVPAKTSFPGLVLLQGGDTLAGTVTGFSEDEVHFVWAGAPEGPPLTIPLETVRSIVLQQPTDNMQRLRLQRQWGLLKPAADRMLLMGGTYADGDLVRLDAEHLTLRTTLGSVETPRADVAAILMNAKLAVVPPPAAQYAVVLTTDGSRITFESLHGIRGQENRPDPGLLNPDSPVSTLIGRTIQGITLTVRIDQVLQVSFFGERVVSLADLTPTSFDFTPYLTERHPLVVHRNVHGGELRLRGKRYATGLGMHSQSKARFDVGGQGFQTFTATIGIDDMADGYGHVLFVVELDGTRVFDSGGVTGKEEPIDVGPIDLDGAKELSLIVEFGQLGNLSDIADWCTPRLIK